MKHDDDVGSGRQGKAVTCFLIAPVAAVLRMHLDPNPGQAARNSRCFIITGVVYQDDLVDDFMRDNLLLSLP